MSANQTNKANAANQKAGLLNEKEQWLDNIGQNKAIQEANLQNAIRTGYKTGILNVQKAQSKRKLIEGGINIHRDIRKATGAATANAAASGTIGSSADAVLNDIQREGAEAVADLDYQADVDDFNFVTMLTDLVTSGQDSLQSGVAGNVAKTPTPVNVGMGTVLLGAAVQTASVYGNQKLNLGLGKS